jgi:hypothetical protein
LRSKIGQHDDLKRILFGSASRQMTCRGPGLFTQPLAAWGCQKKVFYCLRGRILFI